MSNLLARIMLAMLMPPTAVFVHIIVLISSDDLRRFVGYPYGRDIPWLVAGAVTWIFIAVWWLFLWRKTIHWTTWRKRMTLALVAAATIVGGLAAWGMDWNGHEFYYFVFTTMTPLVWLVATVFIWRESTAERASRLAGNNDAIVCPTCGYNLTGLSGARCPECGSSFTLDDLYARQPSRSAVELERG